MATIKSKKPKINQEALKEKADKELKEFHDKKEEESLNENLTRIPVPVQESLSFWKKNEHYFWAYFDDVLETGILLLPAGGVFLKVSKWVLKAAKFAFVRGRKRYIKIEDKNEIVKAVKKWKKAT